MRVAYGLEEQSLELELFPTADPSSRNMLDTNDRVTSSPKSARSSVSLASTVQARGRASSSLPQTPAPLNDNDGSKRATGKVGFLRLS